MGKTIEIRLSDAQHRALSAEAEASGGTFFGYCREKLMAGTEIKRRPASEPIPDPADRSLRTDPVAKDLEQVRNRLDRAFHHAFAGHDLGEPASEAVPASPEPHQVLPTTWGKESTISTGPDRLSRIEDAVARLAEIVMGQQPAQAPQPQPTEPIDVDDMVSRQMAAAEAEGLTEHVPDQADIEMQHAGVRPLHKRPTRFAAASVPRHLQDVL